MRRDRGHPRGFTLVEIMITIMIVGILAALAIPYYFDKIRQAKAGVCETNRQAIEKAVIMHFLDTTLPDGTPIPSSGDLVGMKYMEIEPACPSGGIYIWGTAFYRTGLVPHLGCSIHYLPPG